MRKSEIGVVAIFGLAILILVFSCVNSTIIGRQQEQPDYDQTVYSSYVQMEAEPILTEYTSASSVDTIKTSVKGVPKVKDDISAYMIFRTLDKSDDWLSGKFNNKKNIIVDNSYLSLNSYLPVKSSKYMLLANNKAYRMIINKYSKDNKLLGYADLCNGDIVNLSDSVKYITITIYKYKNRQIVKNSNSDILKDLKNGLVFSISEISSLEEHVNDKEKLTSEVHAESLSNYYSYRTGWFKSWGGAYENLDGSLCTRNLYKVDSKPYIFNVNDSRIALSITEFDAQGNWVKYNEAFKNGDTFKKQPKTSYIGIVIKSRKWGVDLYTLFENGLKIDFASKQYIFKTGTISLSDVDFAITDHWKAGAYLYETGEYIIDSNKICYDKFCKTDSREYVVNLPGGDLRMRLLEIDKEGKVLINNELQSGQRWKKSKNTEKIAITVCGYNKTFSLADYKSFITEYPLFGLNEYIKYTHNTNMKALTAWEFVDDITVGWNLGNSLDTKGKAASKTANLLQELYWGNPYVSKDLIEYVAKSGFNTIRIPVTWYYNTYKDESGKLKISEEWLNRVQEVVDYAIANNMYVIINTHHEQPIIYAGTDNASMKQVLKNAQAIWIQIAERFKTYDEHLIFEAYNEVDNIELSWTYSDKAAEQMNELNQVFVDTVRSTGSNNTNRILMVPTLLDGADSRYYNSFKLPKDSVSNKIVVQIHSYSKKFNQDLDCDFLELEKFSNKIKAPIIIGEFGTTRAYTLPELRPEHASNFVARAAVHGIKCIWWDNGAEYQIINRKDYSASNQEMIHALIAGTKGSGYLLENELILNSPELFVYKMPDLYSGELKKTYWGTLTTDIEDSAIKVQAGENCSVNLKAVNEASGIWLQRVLFYDSQGALINVGTEIQARYTILSIPEGAVSMRVSMNHPNTSITLENFEKYLNSGDLEMDICFFHTEDLKKIKLTLPK